MIETKTIDINKKEKDQVIQEYSIFKWEVEKIDYHKNKIEKMLKQNKGFFEAFKKDPFITITFKRDTNQSNYGKIKEYNEQYNEYKKNKKSSERMESDIKISGSIIFFIIGLLILLIPIIGRKAYVISIILSVLFIGAGGVWMYFAIKKTKESNNNKNSEIKKYEELINQLVDKINEL